MKYFFPFILFVLLNTGCSTKDPCNKIVEAIAGKIVNDSTIEKPTVNFLEKLRRLFDIPNTPSDSLVLRFWFGTGEWYRYAELVELRRSGCTWSANFYGFWNNDEGNLEPIYSKRNVPVTNFADEVNAEFGKEAFYLSFKDPFQQGGTDGVEYVAEIDYLQKRKTAVYSNLDGEEDINDKSFRRGRHYFYIIQQLMKKQRLKIILPLKDLELLSEDAVPEVNELK